MENDKNDYRKMNKFFFAIQKALSVLSDKERERILAALVVWNGK